MDLLKRIDESSEYIKQKSNNFLPNIGIILGSGLGELAEKIESYIKSLDFAHGDIKATYQNNYVRKGTIFAEGQKGILLNEYAIDTLVKQILNMIENLGFTQAKGYMYVEDIEVDYNNFKQPKDMFRIKNNSNEINPQKNEPYAIYFQQGE